MHTMLTYSISLPPCIPSRKLVPDVPQVNILPVYSTDGKDLHVAKIVVANNQTVSKFTVSLHSLCQLCTYYVHTIMIYRYYFCRYSLTLGLVYLLQAMASYSATLLLVSYLTQLTLPLVWVKCVNTFLTYLPIVVQ